MEKQVHILNGDSLRMQLQHVVFGECIILRECLVDGDVSGETPDEFYFNRANFLKTVLQEKNTDFYYQKSVTEFLKIQKIPENSEINLWFEADLFCQVNFWFTSHLLTSAVKNCTFFLIMPNAGNDYNFGKMTDFELLEVFQNKKELESAEIAELGKFWELFRKKDIQNLLKKANKLNSKFPFLLPAILAFAGLIPENGKLNRPEQTILEIIHQLDIVEFEPIFNEFCKREPIYGFGNVQVQRFLNKLTSA